MGRERYSPQAQAYYRNYMRSVAWRTRRDARIKRAGYRCEFTVTRYDPGHVHDERCIRTRGLEVHHLTYERLGAEQDSDLQVLCWFHHLVEHLLWKRCRWCAEPCLSNDAVAELWLKATLAQMGIDPDATWVDWKVLPTKEQLLAQIYDVCVHCRGFKPENQT